MRGESPAQNSVGKRMVMLMGITVGVALGVGGTLALLGGRSNLPVQIDGTQVRTVVLATANAPQHDLARKALLNYVKLETMKDPKVIRGKPFPMTIGADGKCITPTLDGLPFLDDVWAVHTEDSATTLRPYKKPNNCLTTDGRGVDVSRTCAQSLGKGSRLSPVVFDGQYLYPKNNPNKIACCQDGSTVVFKSFDSKSFPGKECQFFVRPVVGPWDFTGRASMQQGGSADADYQDTGDDF